MHVLPQHGGPPRFVEVRIDGHVRQLMKVAADADGVRTLSLPLPRAERVEVAIVVRSPGRPVDLGFNPDTRPLGVLVHRLRIS